MLIDVDLTVELKLVPNIHLRELCMTRPQRCQSDEIMRFRETGLRIPLVRMASTWKPLVYCKQEWSCPILMKFAEMKRKIESKTRSYKGLLSFPVSCVLLKCRKNYWLWNYFVPDFTIFLNVQCSMEHSDLRLKIAIEKGFQRGASKHQL